jgi:RNA polymerase sigma factor (sigma-70 family)
MRKEQANLLHYLRRVGASPETSDLLDCELLHLYATQHDEAAFRTLLRRHGPMVLGVCKRLLQNSHDAEDAFQATFLVLTRKIHSVRWRQSIGTWLYEVAQRLAREAKVRASRRQVHESRAPLRTSGDCLSEITGRELLAVLDEEMSRLPEKWRAPLVLCCLEGHSGEEAARQLGCSLSTLRRRLDQGRQLLHRRLTRRGVALSTAGLSAALLLENVTSAAVPAELATSTGRAALRLLAGESLAGVVSEQAQEWLEATMQTLKAGKVKWAAALLLLGVVSAGAGTLLYQAAAQAPGDRPPEAATPNRSEVPPKPRDAEGVDRLGDPLPPGAVARMGTVRLRTGNIVNSVAWTPGGKLLASAGEGRLIQIWDPTSGREVARLPVPNRVKCLTFSPDGKWLAATGDYAGINLWDAALFGKQDRPRQLAGLESGSCLAFAPNSKTLYSCGHDGFIRAWDMATGRELRRFGLREFVGKGGPWFTCIALDPDGSLLVSRNIALDGDNLQVVATHLWNPATGERLRQLGKTERATSGAESYSAVFASDGRTVAAVNDDGMKIWNADTGAEVAVLKVRSQRVAFAPDGKSLYGGHDGQLCQWAVPSGRLLRSFTGDCRSDSPIALSPDAKTLATGDRFSLAFWEVETGKRRHSWPGHDTEVWTLFFLNGGKELLTAGCGSPVHRWDLEGRPLGAWKQPEGWDGTTFALSPDGKTLAVQNNALQAQLVDPLTGTVRQSFNNHQRAERWRKDAYFQMQFAFSPDSRRVLSAASGIDMHVRLWEADTARETWSVATGKPDTLVQGFALSPDGQTMYLTSDPGPVKVYQVGKDQPQRQIGTGVIRSLCLSPDGRRLAGAGSDHLFIWDAATGAEVCRLPRPKVSELYNRRFLKFSPDGRMLAIWTGDEPTARCVEIASGQVRLETSGHLEMVLAAEFSADGRLLATGGTDTTVLLWDLRTLALASEPARNVDVEGLWSELAAPDARIAYRAVVRLQQLGPRAVPLLAERLKPEKIRPLAACLADLDDDDFPVRERATEELMGRTGDRGELEKALAATRSAEVRTRLQLILGRLGEYDPRKDERRLRSLRGLETLEGLGTPQARRIVETLARGAPEAELTREAAATLRRMR